MKFLLHKDKEINATAKIAHLANPTLKLTLRLPKELFLPLLLFVAGKKKIWLILKI
jgi:hypothetical protein